MQERNQTSSAAADAEQAERRPLACLLVTSNGGHLLELVQLRDEWERFERHWVTFDTPDVHSILAGEAVTYAYHPTNRNAKNLLRNAWLAVRLLRDLRPRAVVTAGAGVAVPFCYAARLFGARVIYVESFARITNPSLTGRLVYPVAHRFFVQWPGVRRFFRRAEYLGPLV